MRLLVPLSQCRIYSVKHMVKTSHLGVGNQPRPRVQLIWEVFAGMKGSEEEWKMGDLNRARPIYAVVIRNVGNIRL